MAQLGIGSDEWRVQRTYFLFVGIAVLSGLFFVNLAQSASLIDVYHLAQKNDPTFQSAYFIKSVTDESRKQAISRLLPTLDGSAEYMRRSQDIKSSDNDVFGSGKTDFDTTSYSITLTQPVFHWDLIVGLKQSKAEIFRAEAEYILAQQELIIRVADLYFMALATQDQLAFAKTELSAVEKHLELASNRLEMGLIPITDLYDAKARMSTTQAQTIEAQNQLDDALQALREVTDESIDQLQVLPVEIPLVSPQPTDLDSWIKGGLEQSLAVEIQRQVVEVSRQEVRRQNTGHYPTVDLVARYNRTDTEGTIFGGGSDVGTGDLVLQLNVPLYQGGFVSSRVREAKYQLNVARQELIKQKRMVERQTRAAFLGTKSAIKRVEALRQSVFSIQLALEAKQEGFLSGLYTSLTVLDAERDLSLVRIDYAQARYNYILNSLKLKQAVGSLISQDLVDLDQWFQ